MSVSKNNPAARNKILKDAVHIKWVKKAHSWARTEIANNKQVVSFHPTRQDAINNENKF